MPRNIVVLILRLELTRHANLWSQFFKVKGKPHTFEAYYMWIIIFVLSLEPYAFYNKQLRTLFIGQLARSKTRSLER